MARTHGVARRKKQQAGRLHVRPSEASRTASTIRRGLTHRNRTSARRDGHSSIQGGFTGKAPNGALRLGLRSYPRTAPEHRTANRQHHAAGRRAALRFGNAGRTAPRSRSTPPGPGRFGPEKLRAATGHAWQEEGPGPKPEHRGIRIPAPTYRRRPALDGGADSIPSFGDVLVV